MKRSTVIALSLIALIAIVGISVAKADGENFCHGRRGPGGPMMGERLLDKLELTAQQKKEIEELKKELKTQAAPLHENLRQMQSQMMNLWLAPSPDGKAIISLERKMNAIRLQLSELHIQMRLDVLQILDAEQKAELKEMAQKFMEKQKRHRGDFFERDFHGEEIE